MHPNSRLLVIGPNTLSETAGRALPSFRIVGRSSALAGVWQLGKQSFDGVLLSLSTGKKALRALRSLREIDPHAHIVLSCTPADEPAARQALGEGADDYILEPLSPRELEECFATPAAPSATPTTPAAPENGPSVDELVKLSDVLKSLGDGPQKTLERFAMLLRDSFRATGVSIELDDLSASAGEIRGPGHEEPILRKGESVGHVVLAGSAYAAPAADVDKRLSDYTLLIDAAVSQARERQHWRDLAWTDDLSGLRNRRYLEMALADLIIRAKEQDRRLTVLLFDIDDFKSYNDRYGHDTGDSLIREVSTLLTHCSREHDLVARFGGDEFVVVFWDADKPRIPGSKHPTEPVALAKRFCREIREHHFQCLGPDAPGPVTISGGLASFPRDGEESERLIAAADQALLTAKRTGKNRIELAGGGRREA